MFLYKIIVLLLLEHADLNQNLNGAFTAKPQMSEGGMKLLVSAI